MTGSDAPDLAARQAALVRALVAGDAVPPGFDVCAIHAAAHSLLHKRAREVAARYPGLAYAAGPDFAEQFVAWARTRPKRGAAADARRFARDSDIRWGGRGPEWAKRLTGLFRNGTR
ncbi:hypothetical protein [Nocardia sp. NPDC024068]|uniref:hypothetical protein n=1 Tax=Nocardia sp. NPDC024068 TaxID=3157197 RepID=UPI0033FD76ED